MFTKKESRFRSVLLGFVINAGNIQMDPVMIRVVTDWPTPTCKELWLFLDFSNFYRRFIRNYSSAAPQSVLSGSPVGPLFLLGLSPRGETHLGTVATMLLVALHGGGHQMIHRRLPDLLLT